MLSRVIISKCSSHITSELSVYSFHYNDLTLNSYNCSKCYVTVVLLLKHSFMENYEQYYISEATEDWVCSGVISFKMPVVGRKKIPKVYFIVIRICFSNNTVNVFLEGDRAGFNPAKRWRRGWEPSGWEGPRTMFSGGPNTPPTECDLPNRRPHSKISAKGPEFLTTALRAIMVSGPSTVYHPVFTPILPSPYCNQTEEFFSTWRWKVFNRLLTNKSLFSRP